VQVPAEGDAKEIVWTVAGPNKQRWLELSALKLIPSQQVGVRLQNGGYQLAFDNDGPTTSAVLRVEERRGRSRCRRGNIEIPAEARASARRSEDDARAERRAARQ